MQRKPSSSWPVRQAASCSTPGHYCTLGRRTCGACCWSEAVPRPRLEARLRRHLHLFARRLRKGRRPGPLALLLHETRALDTAQLLAGLASRLPLTAATLRTHIARRLVCPFAAFLDPAEARVGCLLHPQIWDGRDVRSTALRLLPGFTCGAAAFFCDAAERLASASEAARDAFERETQRLDWFEYGRAVQRFHEPVRRAAPCPSSSTSH